MNINVNGVKTWEPRLYQNFQESDELGLTNDRTTMKAAGTTKIDYSFVPRTTHYIVHDAYIFSSAYSDHKVLVAYQRGR